MSPSVRTQAWRLFDHLVATASDAGSPWRVDPATGMARFVPDSQLLRRLLGVPLHLGAPSQSGVPALALDVWIAAEFRRAGFDQDAVWPRAVAPRILPQEVAAVLAALPRPERAILAARLARGIPEVTAAQAVVLGKNYRKQVDVVMSNWRTGPELLVSTKRMDSSFGKNAANRVEESYGDAKNLRLRHPLAALGFCYALRSTALVQEPDTAEWLIDLLGKLGREDDAYHAVGLVVPEWDQAGVPHDAAADAPPSPEDPDDPDDPLVAAGLVPPEDDNWMLSLELDDPGVAAAGLADQVAALPQVRLRQDAVPPQLRPERFFTLLIERILDITPVTMHREARRRRADPIADRPGDRSP
jgi:hypothetical protein